MLSRRISERLWRHHLPIGLVTLASGAALYVTRSYPDVITRLSFSSAYPALFLVAATLLVGPWKVLAGSRLAVSLDLRRDLGIWAGMVSIFHAVIGNCEHLRGRPWLYYVYENWRDGHVMPLRYDLFGLGNHTGLIAALIILALLATSNDAALRKLGTPGWKKLQRWNYAVFALVAVHTWTYQFGVKAPEWGWIGTASSAIAAVALLQLIGWRRRRAL
jgi:methionine sulfoxide reductase heme-binding subunit